MLANARVIIALDFESASEAMALVDCLGSSATHFKTGLQLLTSEGPAVVKALVSQGKKVLALTVVTSLRDDDLKDIGVPDAVTVQAARLARLAMMAGCHGVIASRDEAALLREMLPLDALIVTPVIQLVGPIQSRSANPEAAIRAGATHIVIGGAITRAQSPCEAFALACAQV